MVVESDGRQSLSVKLFARHGEIGYILIQAVVRGRNKGHQQLSVAAIPAGSFGRSVQQSPCNMPVVFEISHPNGTKDRSE